MKIEKGKLYYCIKDVVMQGLNHIEFKKDRVYLSEQKNCLTNESKDIGHIVSSYKDFNNEDYFTNKIAVHCPTEQDKNYVGVKYGLEYVFSNLHALKGYDYIMLDEDDTFTSHSGLREDYRIININQFKEFYPEVHYDLNSLEEQNESEKILSKAKEQASEGIKFSEGKLSWEVDFDFLEEIAKRMELSTKYPPYNWQKPLDEKELLKAGWRHYVEMMKGNFEDEGQSLGHLFATVTNLMMYYYQVKNK